MLAPVPGILEGLDLRLGVLAGLVPEQYRVVAVGVEGRIQVDEVYALVGDVFAQDGKVVSVEQGVGGNSRLQRGSSPKTVAYARIIIAKRLFVSLHLYPAPQHVEPRRPRWMRSQAILAPLRARLCKILHANFREYPFHALR